MQEENTDVVGEVVAPTEQNPQNIAQPQETQSDKDYNFAQMRKAMDDQKRQIDELTEFSQYLQKQVTTEKTPQPQAEQEPEPWEGLASDEWATVEVTDKLAQRRAEEAVKRALEAEKARQQEQQVKKYAEDSESNLRKEFTDFDQVVTKENVEYLKATKPYLAQVLATASNDPYAQGKAAYEFIKQNCPAAQVAKEKELVDQNALRPGSMDASAPMRTQEHDPLRMTPDRRSQLWQEMQQLARG